MVRLQQQTDKAIRGASRSVNGPQYSHWPATRSARDGRDCIRPGLAALTAACPSIREMVKEVADLGDAADRIGITTDHLQELHFQAEQTGSSAEAMTDALQQFAKRWAKQEPARRSLRAVESERAGA